MGDELLNHSQVFLPTYSKVLSVSKGLLQPGGGTDSVFLSFNSNPQNSIELGPKYNDALIKHITVGKAFIPKYPS